MLTRPRASVRDIEARRYSQMLMLLVLFQIPLVIITMIAAIMAVGDRFYAEAFFLIPTFLLVTYSVAYGLGKVGRWRWGALAFVAPIYIGIWAALIRNPELQYIGFDMALGILLLPVLFTGLFYSLPVVVITATGNILASTIIPLLLDVPLASYSTTLIIIASVSFITVIAIHYRNMIESERLAELQERESRLAKTEKMAHLGSWEWDMGTNELTWSSEEYRILGFDLENPITLEMFMERVHPDDRERVEQANRDIINSEEGVITEFRILHPEWGERYIFSIAEPIQDENGKVIRAVGFEQDVTEQIKSREEFRKAKEAAEEALSQIKQLRGLLPICSYCKKIRRDDDAWQQLEHYITDHSEAEFSHGVCPECYVKHLEPQLTREQKQSGQSRESRH
ncbi:PAS domain-containing protein [Candidatus Neomarinimicrobiota bacterium]